MPVHRSRGSLPSSATPRPSIEFAEDQKGTIALGMLADIAVLSQDIFTVALDELPKTASALTSAGGEIVQDQLSPRP